MKTMIAIIGVAALLSPAVVSAQAPAPASSERRLSPAQVEAILEEAAKRRQAEARHQIPVIEPEAPKPQIHGEVGVTVGTGGYREVYGTAVAPLGEEGAAAISMDYVDWGHRRYRR